MSDSIGLRLYMASFVFVGPIATTTTALVLGMPLIWMLLLGISLGLANAGTTFGIGKYMERQGQPVKW